MVNLDAVISSLIAQAPLVVIVILVLYYRVDRKIDKVYSELNNNINEMNIKLDKKFNEAKAEFYKKINEVEVELSSQVGKLSSQIGELRREIKSLASGFYNYQNTLIDFLAAKGLVTAAESVLLRGSLKASIPYAMSKYYTEEVRRRLQALLDKELEEYTWEDAAELENIAKLMYKEYIATGREDLLDYYPKLMMYAAIVRGLLRRRELEKKQQSTAL